MADLNHRAWQKADALANECSMPSASREWLGVVVFCGLYAFGVQDG